MTPDGTDDRNEVTPETAQDDEMAAIRAGLADAEAGRFASPAEVEAAFARWWLR